MWCANLQEWCGSGREVGVPRGVDVAQVGEEAVVPEHLRAGGRVDEAACVVGRSGPGVFMRWVWVLCGDGVGSVDGAALWRLRVEVGGCTVLGC